MKRILRVFPRKTTASPDDSLAAFGPPGLFPPEVDEIHISVLFTYDLQKAERLEQQWKPIAPVFMGGPAIGTYPEEFIPGKYVKQGYTITSRGCVNRGCWFCRVPAVEGAVMRELPICGGHNILDSNLLACSDDHIKNVFLMLQKQKEPIEFTGGLEAARLKSWHVEEIVKLKLARAFFAYDTPNDYDPLVEAGKLLKAGKINAEKCHCFVLIGYKNDTFERAEERLMQAAIAGFVPMAMLYRDQNGITSPVWRRFQRIWARPPITISKICHKLGYNPFKIKGENNGISKDRNSL